MRSPSVMCVWLLTLLAAPFATSWSHHRPSSADLRDMAALMYMPQVTLLYHRESILAAYRDMSSADQPQTRLASRRASMPTQRRQLLAFQQRNSLRR